MNKHFDRRETNYAKSVLSLIFRKITNFKLHNTPFHHKSKQIKKKKSKEYVNIIYYVFGGVFSFKCAFSTCVTLYDGIVGVWQGDGRKITGYKTKHTHRERLKIDWSDKECIKYWTYVVCMLELARVTLMLYPWPIRDPLPKAFPLIYGSYYVQFFVFIHSKFVRFKEELVSYFGFPMAEG